jgi:hypothetical protein
MWRHGERTGNSITPSLDTNGDFRQQLVMNLYRITVRDQNGKVSHYETSAPSLYLAGRTYTAASEVLKVERINPLTEEVLGGFYNE